VIPALGRLRQEVCEFKASLEYIVRPVLSVKKKKKEDLSLVTSSEPSIFR
jgi:hypothetical protein